MDPRDKHAAARIAEAVEGAALGPAVGSLPIRLEIRQKRICRARIVVVRLAYRDRPRGDRPQGDRPS